MFNVIKYSSVPLNIPGILVLFFAAILAGCQTTGVKTWKEKSGNIPERANPNLETVRYYYDKYQSRGTNPRFGSEPSKNPMPLVFETRESTTVTRALENTYLSSYMMYEDGKVVINEKSPLGRLGEWVEDDDLLESMSLGKSLTSYLMGHAICQGYIQSVDSSLSDWPLAQGSLLEKQTVRDVINATMGDSRYMKDGVTIKGQVAGMNSHINSRTMLYWTATALAGKEPGSRIFNYSELPAKTAINYISYKTGDNFREFLNDVMQNYVGLEGELYFGTDFFGAAPVRDGVINGLFRAKREDYMRLGIAMLNDWNTNNCVGQYLKDVYQNSVRKGNVRGKPPGDGFSRSYAGFFHTNYPSISDTVMGMDGYGGIALLINFTDNRVVSAHAAHRDYNYRKLILDAVEDGDI